MKRWIGAAAVAGTLALMGPAATKPAVAASSKGDVHAADAPKATEHGARRRTRHHTHDVYRPYAQPYDDDRPNYYRPYLYAAPVPFFLGFGFGPSW